MTAFEGARAALAEYASSQPNDYERAYAEPLAAALRALIEPPTEEWEYGIRSKRTGNAWVIDRPLQDHEEPVRRRKAGPWEPVT